MSYNDGSGGGYGGGGGGGACCGMTELEFLLVGATAVGDAFLLICICAVLTTSWGFGGTTALQGLFKAGVFLGIFLDLGTCVIRFQCCRSQKCGTALFKLYFQRALVIFNVILFIVWCIVGKINVACTGMAWVLKPFGAIDCASGGGTAAPYILFSLVLLLQIGSGFIALIMRHLHCGSGGQGGGGGYGGGGGDQGDPNYDLSRNRSDRKRQKRQLEAWNSDLSEDSDDAPEETQPLPQKAMRIGKTSSPYLKHQRPGSFQDDSDDDVPAGEDEGLRDLYSDEDDLIKKAKQPYDAPREYRHPIVPVDADEVPGRGRRYDSLGRRNSQSGSLRRSARDEEEEVGMDSIGRAPSRSRSRSRSRARRSLSMGDGGFD